MANFLCARVLAYHTIDAYPHAMPAGIDMPTESFAAQMDFISKRYRVIPLAEMVELIKTGKRVPRDALSITFDDGYRDNYLNAFPILRDLELPATIFCVSDYLNQDWPADNWAADAPKEMLRTADMQEMVAGGITFGSHGTQHVQLVPLPDEDLAKSLTASRAKITELCGQPTEFISYPFGVFDERVKSACLVAGYAAAFAVWTRTPDLFALNRIPLRLHDVGLRYRLKIWSYPYLRRYMK